MVSTARAVLSIGMLSFPAALLAQAGPSEPQIIAAASTAKINVGTRKLAGQMVATVRVGDDGRVREVLVTENTADSAFEPQLVKVLQSARFLRPPSKNERVAALQPAYGLAFTSFFNHEPFDAFLLHVFMTWLFSDIDNFGILASFIKQTLVDQTIVEHNIGFAQARQTPYGDQVRIPRPRADDEYSSRVLHCVFS